MSLWNLFIVDEYPTYHTIMKNLSSARDHMQALLNLQSQSNPSESPAAAKAHRRAARSQSKKSPSPSPSTPLTPGVFTPQNQHAIKKSTGSSLTLTPENVSSATSPPSSQVTPDNTPRHAASVTDTDDLFSPPNIPIGRGMIGDFDYAARTMAGGDAAGQGASLTDAQMQLRLRTVSKLYCSSRLII